MRRKLSGYNSEQGVSLVEIVMVIVALGFLILLIANLPSSFNLISRSRHQSLAKDVALRKIDSLRKQGYSNLVDGVNTFVDNDLVTLSSPSASYVISDCVAPVCTNAELAKQISVVVNWNESGDNKKVELSTIVSSGGLGQ